MIVQKERQASGAQVLPDVLGPHLRLLFVGINPGLRSAAVGHHFAGYSNRFWTVLSASGLVPRPLTYLDDQVLPQYGIGLMNLVDRATAGSEALSAAERQQGRTQVLHKVQQVRPQVAAFLGLTVAAAVLGPLRTRGRGKYAPQRPQVGLQPDLLEGASIFVLPNPSGRNAHYPFDTMVELCVMLRVHLAGCGNT
jgi:TDG/mug DNA glycosylase family protein